MHAADAGGLIQIQHHQAMSHPVCLPNLPQYAEASDNGIQERIKKVNHEANLLPMLGSEIVSGRCREPRHGLC